MGFLSDLFGSPRPTPLTKIVNVLGEVLLEVPARDLSELDLSNRDLRHVCLKGLTLWKVNLENSNLLGADCSRTSFQKCNMKGVELSFSNCTSADFRGSDLDGCLMYRSETWGAHFDHAIISQTSDIPGIYVSRRREI